VRKSEEAKVLREFLTKVDVGGAPKGRASFSELQRMIEGISQRMLKTTLRNLERDGFATREIFPEVPPKVEYELTYLGLSLLEPMEHLVAWIGGHWSSITKARERFDLSQQARVREINRAER